jgi:hypothetical protein
LNSPDRIAAIAAAIRADLSTLAIFWCVIVSTEKWDFKWDLCRGGILSGKSVTTHYSIALFAIVHIAFRSIGSITCTFTCRKRLSSSVGGGGRLATLAHEGLFEVVEAVGVVIAIEDAFPSFRTAL